MSLIELVGPLAGVLALIVAVLNAFTTRRGQEATERVEDERLGHADLVDALEAQRHTIADLRIESAEHKKAAERWEAEAKVNRDKVNDLLYMLERRRGVE